MPRQPLVPLLAPVQMPRGLGHWGRWRWVVARLLELVGKVVGVSWELAMWQMVVAS